MISANLFFSSVIVGSILSNFFISTKGMYINRTFLNMPLSIAINSIDYTLDDSKSDKITIDERKIYYFNVEKVKYNINKYLKSSFKNNIDSYLIGFNFYKKESESLVLNNISPNLFKVRLKVNYYKYFNFDSSISFYIKDMEIEKYEWKIN